ncbi:hypothetical protein CONLIGDRAFT_114947 [Coniochaeta ligniaria NRRL 30616]|uniref:MARVEL domain-containing protein n=1 Tax=Coniochaeta ligniaria NRRL 30616 TaxID=1408157 RepID=A0A1J7IS34_9PEZI|nr:hypothetical protein CONLIGDRAFT_114947 [Coniochaeta ligniaria NRRL 30616]
MTFKDHGYYGYAYLGARIAQAIALVPIVGLVGNFLSLIAKSKHSPPSELIATIVFVRFPFPNLVHHPQTNKPKSAISILWVLLSMTAYHDTHIPYLATLALDTLFLIPFIVFAVIIGQPLSLTTCSDLPATASHVALPISTLPGQPVSYVVFSGAGQTTCYELMAVWGLMIALCVLFAMSAVSAGFLFLGKRRSGAAVGSGTGGPPGRGTFPGGGGYPMNDSQIEMAGGKGSFSRSPSFGPGGSRPGTPFSGAGRRPVSPGDFDGPMPPRGPPGGFDDSPRGSFDDGPLSPPPRR